MILCFGFMQIKLLHLKMLEAVIMIEIAMESGIILWPLISGLLLDQVLHHVLVDYLASQDWGHGSGRRATGN